MKEFGIENFKNPVEASANYQGNWALLSYERWKTKESIEKLAHLYYKHLTTLKEPKDLELEVKTVPFVLPNLEDDRYDLWDEINQMSLENQEQENEAYQMLIIKKYPFLVSPLELQRMLEIESGEYCQKFIMKKLRESLDLIFSHTEIGHTVGGSGKSGTVGRVALRNTEILPGIRLSNAHQQSLIEAHEKGHGMRWFERPSEISDMIQSGFDIDNVKISKKVTEIYENEIKNDRPELLKRKGYMGRVKKSQIFYETHPCEIMERMSQLKNYFGMSQYTEFTKEHLDYSRKHFIEDIGGIFDMQMEAFFSMITKGKEKRFLELMNTLPL